ncbi:hypothetical protein EV182_003958 [Spiromyces aspiralis]|uniref:Uncharacterized protein n=1 Tax=Spiromyces aspiralis TaxID=68401 RepID=A0ACC1HS40_9FUNG|nr:hypothetical protein EV182_003958 [Spiromyces aspiralis]
MSYTTIEDGVTLDSCIVCQHALIGADSSITKSEIGAGVVLPANSNATKEQLVTSAPSEDTEGITVAFG